MSEAAATTPRPPRQENRLCRHHRDPLGSRHAETGAARVETVYAGGYQLQCDAREGEGPISNVCVSPVRWGGDKYFRCGRTENDPLAKAMAYLISYEACAIRVGLMDGLRVRVGSGE